MTKQESKVLEIIKQDPTIQQDQIGKILNISRSTVAVHISSLQNQGYILGKGYVLKKDEYILGIGAANVDVYGKSKIKIRTHYDHPANISSNVGGVTKNILTNLSKLGSNVSLITALGDDGYGKTIKDDCKNNNINIKDSLTVNGKSSGVFMQIQDENNDMYLAICDMSILEEITPEYLRSKSNIITQAKMVLFDPSLNDESIKELIRICKNKVELYVDPISDNYALKIKPYIKDIDCIKPNRSELENLSGMKIKTIKDVEIACYKLIDKGLKKIFVSLSQDGILYMDSQGNKIHRKLKPVKNMVNASGAGDASMAAIMYGISNGFKIEKTIDYGLAAGIVAIMSKKTINEKMSVELINKVIKENKQ